MISPRVHFFHVGEFACAISALLHLPESYFQCFDREGRKRQDGGVASLLPSDALSAPSFLHSDFSYVLVSLKPPFLPNLFGIVQEQPASASEETDQGSKDDTADS